MGYYINPPGQTKEEFLQDWAVPISEKEFRAYKYNNGDGKVPVIWTSNLIFTAVVIAYNKDERKEFLRPDDYRPKKFYLIPINALDVKAGLPKDFPASLVQLMTGGKVAA